MPVDSVAHGHGRHGPGSLGRGDLRQPDDAHDGAAASSCAAAAAREKLLDLAAERWKVEARRVLRPREGSSNARRASPIGYGELTRRTKARHGSSPPAPPRRRRRVEGRTGTRARRSTGRDFVTGKHRYASDLVRPGMLHGKVLRAGRRSRRARLGLETSRQRRSPASRSSGTAISSASPRADPASAERALAALEAEVGASPPQPSQQGDLRVLKKSAESSERDCRHGLRKEQGRDRVGGREARADLHRRLHRPRASRAAGRRRGVERRPADGVDRDAAPVCRARRAGRGVSDCAGERARAGARHRFGVRRQAHRRRGARGGAPLEGGRQAGQGRLDTRGRIHVGVFPPGWRHRSLERREARRDDHRLGSSTTPTRARPAIATPYTSPNQTIQFHPVASPLRQGSYRGLAATANHFARESHMDELARARSGWTRSAFRLEEHLPTRASRPSSRRPRTGSSGKAKPAAGADSASPAASRRAATSRPAPRWRWTRRRAGSGPRPRRRGVRVRRGRQPRRPAQPGRGGDRAGRSEARSSRRSVFENGRIANPQLLLLSRARAWATCRRSRS